MAQTTGLTDPYKRAPLSISTNEVNLEVQWIASPAKQLVRKASQRNLLPYIDSSESLPSIHSSIYEASYINASTENVNEELSTEFFVTGGRSLSALRNGTIPCTQYSQPTISATPATRTIHHPTPLDTITEQNSLATLRSPIHKSSLLSQLSKPISSHTLRASAQARHKQSFSLDDLTLFQPPLRSKSLFQTSSDDSSITNAPSTLHTTTTFSLYPKLPSQPPPRPRVPTPPGIPTFNTPAAAAYILPPPPSLPGRLFHDLFSRKRALAKREYREQTSRLPRGVVMRGENGILVRGRWRAGLSGHTGTHGGEVESNLMAGLTFRTPGPQVGVRVQSRRFVSSVADDHGDGRDNAAATLAARGRAVGSVVGIDRTDEGVWGVRGGREESAIGPDERLRDGGKSYGKERLRDVFCFVCCGAEVGAVPGEEGGVNVRPRVVVPLARRG